MSQVLFNVNYHSHTVRCQHAIGTEREYVEAALAAGYRRFGFADHTPQPYEPGVVSRMRMTMAQLEGYVRTVTDLQAEFRGQIEIPLGLEVEYFPAYFPELVRQAEQYPITYFLLAQHMIDTEFSGIICGFPTKDPEILHRYCAQAMEALDTGKFACFAHPDILNFQGDDQVYAREMSAMLDKVKQVGIPVEVNLLGLEQGRNYPDDRFWTLVAQKDLPVIWGLDAHRPPQIGNGEVQEKAKAFTERFGLRLVDELDMTRLKGK